MKLKHGIGALVISTSIVLACSSTPAGTSVESPDIWAESDPMAVVAVVEPTVVAGYQSAPASVSAVQIGPAPAPEWEVTEGHMTIVGFDATP